MCCFNGRIRNGQLLCDVAVAPVPKSEVLVLPNNQRHAGIDISRFDLEVAEIETNENSNFEVIIGMDIIMRGSFYVSGDMYSFCI